MVKRLLVAATATILLATAAACQQDSNHPSPEESASGLTAERDRLIDTAREVAPLLLADDQVNSAHGEYRACEDADGSGWINYVITFSTEQTRFSPYERARIAHDGLVQGDWSITGYDAAVPRLQATREGQDLSVTRTSTQSLNVDIELTSPCVETRPGLFDDEYADSAETFALFG